MTRRAGVTLVELLIVVTIIAVVTGVSVPALVAGLSSLRLSTAAGQVASFLTSTMNRVDRREEAASLEVTPLAGKLLVYTAASGEKPARALELPQGITIEPWSDHDRETHRYLFVPGGTVPRVTVTLRNDKGARRAVRIDPVTAVPDIVRAGAAQ